MAIIHIYCIAHQWKLPSLHKYRLKVDIEDSDKTAQPVKVFADP